MVAQSKFVILAYVVRLRARGHLPGHLGVTYWQKNTEFHRRARHVHISQTYIHPPVSCAMYGTGTRWGLGVVLRVVSQRATGCALFHAETFDTELIGGADTLKHVERPCGAKTRDAIVCVCVCACVCVGELLPKKKRYLTHPLPPSGKQTPTHAISPCPQSVGTNITSPACWTEIF